MIRFFLSLILLNIVVFSPALAKPLTAAEIRDEMLNRTIITRRFGMKVTMRYRSGGKVSAEALLGSVNGTWRPQGNKICSTFPSGPAKGTSCVSFTRVGPDNYVSSEGVRFRIVD